MEREEQQTEEQEAGGQNEVSDQADGATTEPEGDSKPTPDGD